MKKIKKQRLYYLFSGICAILLVVNFIRTDSWTGALEFSEFTKTEWSMFKIFIMEEVVLGCMMFLFAYLGGKNMSSSEKQNRYLDDLLIKGIVDTRKLVGVMNAKKLPYGEFGLCLVCLKDNILNIYDTDFKQDPGALLYSVELKKVTNLKWSSFIFNSYIKFTYEGFNFKLADGVYKELFLEIENEVSRH